MIVHEFGKDVDAVKMRSNQHVTEQAAIDRGHEGTEINMRGIVIAVVGLMVAGFVALLVSWWLMRGMEHVTERQDVPRSPLAAQVPDQAPPQPWLQPSPPQGPEPRQPWRDTLDYLKQEETQLASYRVLDAKSGRVQIPIDRAMLILAAPTTGPASRPTATRPNREPSGGLVR
jgi:hypothetical protein